MAKKTEVPKKHQLKTGDIKKMIARWQEIEAEMEPLESELDGIKAALASDLDVKDALEFGDTTLRIMQNWTRPIKWKDVAAGLAKKLYPDVAAYRNWLRTIIKKYPKKPSKAFPRLFIAKPEEEVA